MNCTPLRHAVESVTAPGVMIESSGPIRQCYGDDPDDWSNWFTCCEVTHLASKRNIKAEDCLPVKQFFRAMRIRRWLGRRLAKAYVDRVIARQRAAVTPNSESGPS